MLTLGERRVEDWLDFTMQRVELHRKRLERIERHIEQYQTEATVLVRQVEELEGEMFDVRATLPTKETSDDR